MENEFDPQNLVKIKITHLIKFASSFAGIEVHLYLNGKYIKMNYASDHFVEILRKLQQKEVEEVYINQEDCQKVLGEIQNGMSSKSFYDPKTTDEERMERAENSVEVVKNLINQLGVDKQTVEILKSVNQKTIGLLSESPSIFMFIKQFKKNCSEEFLRSVLTAYLTSLVIDKFPWKSAPVKEKAALASMLCDITLTKEDFAALKDHDLNVSNGPIMIAMNGGMSLYYSTHKKKCPERDTCSSFAPWCENPAQDEMSVNHLIFSSEPLQGENIWRKLKPGELVGVDEKMKLQEILIDLPFVKVVA